MYVLVHKGYVVLGPFKWSRKKFETALEEDYEIITTLPDRMSEGVPYTIDADTKIYSVVAGEDIPHNPRTEVRNGPFWDFTETHAIYHYEPIQLDLQVAKSFMFEELANERWIKENGGCTVILNGTEYSFGTDRETRNILQNALVSPQETMNWKVGNDNWITLSKADIQTVLDTILTHTQSCFDWEKQVTDEINSCVSHDDLLSVVIKEESTNIGTPGAI